MRVTRERMDMELHEQFRMLGKRGISFLTSDLKQSPRGENSRTRHFIVARGGMIDGRPVNGAAKAAPNRFTPVIVDGVRPMTAA
jgi:hypothetical protein